ncbi:MAG: hypothetical protein AAF571_08265 [Verrucomicrobiota bacterium]
MSIRNLSLITVITVFCCVSLAEGDQAILLKDWSEIGKDTDNTFTGNGTDGFSERFGSSADDNSYASGGIAHFTSDVSLDELNHTLRLSFTVHSIKSSKVANNAFRVGFRNDDQDTTRDATIHYIFGWGSGDPQLDAPDARFAGASEESNVFSQGTSFDVDSKVDHARPLATGNTCNIVVTLKYLGQAGEGNYRYEADILWNDGEHKTSTSFTRNTNRWDAVYIVTNMDEINVAGDGYTVSDVELTLLSEAPAKSYAMK